MREEINTMKQATHSDAVYIARFLNLNIETVWEIIRGMKYSSQNELEMAVHHAFLHRHPVSHDNR
jgi:hypothetical protein